MLSLEMFQQALPDKMKKTVNHELVDRINTLVSDPEAREAYRDNLIGYAHVMRDGKFKIEQYIDAVRYVSFKLMGCTNKDAYIRTFPDKYQRFVGDGVAEKDIASYITAYSKGKLVNLIMEQTLVPIHVLNMDMYQSALNEQFQLGLTAKSEMVRATALTSVLTQLRPPETKKFELDIGMKEDQSINVMRQAMIDLANVQRKAIESGAMNAQQVAHAAMKVIDQDMQEVGNGG
jgi:hypothetical protein